MKNKYNEIVTELTDKFEESIPNDEEKSKELIKSFNNYLNMAVSSLENLYERDFDAEKKNITIIAEQLINADLTTKKRELIRDASLEQIKTISQQAFELAQKRLNGENIEVNIDMKQIVTHMKELLTSVDVYNNEQAKILVSEALLDFNFYNNANAKISSLRLGKIIENKKRN